MKLFITFAFFVACQALKPLDITGPTPPEVPCPHSLCKGKADGNYEYDNYGQYEPHHFVQCIRGLAYCQACWPRDLEFSQKCNQCLYSKSNACVTAPPWVPATTFECPDKCPSRGPYFSGNIEDPHNPQQYVACWHGATVGCVACPKGLLFNEQWNACLFEGKFKTEKS